MPRVMDPLAPRVLRRFLAGAETVEEYLKKSRLNDVVTGMMAEAKKDGVHFGLKDARAALEDWFLHGGKEPTTPAGKAARRFIESDKGKKLLPAITKGVGDVLKNTKGKAGFRDVGEAIIEFLK